jgi:hypothetical protein
VLLRPSLGPAAQLPGALLSDAAGMLPRTQPAQAAAPSTKKPWRFQLPKHRHKFTQRARAADSIFCQVSQSLAQARARREGRGAQHRARVRARALSALGSRVGTARARARLANRACFQRATPWPRWLRALPPAARARARARGGSEGARARSRTAAAGCWPRESNPSPALLRASSAAGPRGGIAPGLTRAGGQNKPCMYQINAVACACYTFSFCLPFSLVACLHFCNSPAECAVEAQKRLSCARSQRLREELEQQQLDERGAELCACAPTVRSAPL